MTQKISFIPTQLKGHLDNYSAVGQQSGSGSYSSLLETVLFAIHRKKTSQIYFAESWAHSLNYFNRNAKTYFMTPFTEKGQVKFILQNHGHTV